MFGAVTRFQFLLPDWTPDPERWYCLHCIDVSDTGSGWDGPRSVMSHIVSLHDVDRDEQSNGVDYVPGSQLLVMLRRWREVNDGMVSQFERKLGSILSVDDFLFETGKP